MYKRVAKSVGEEQLGGAEAAIGLAHAEHALRVRLGADEHVVLQVHAALGTAGAARGIQPERHRVPVRRLRRRAAGDDSASSASKSIAPGDAPAPTMITCSRRGSSARSIASNSRSSASLITSDAGAAVPERMRVVLRAPQRIQRHRHDAGLDRAEEAVGERGRVLQDQRDALFGLNAEAPAAPSRID